MIPITIDSILKPKSSQVRIRNREESEENLEYVSHKKLEKLKTSYQKSLEKSNPGPKSVSQHADDKSIGSKINNKKKAAFKGADYYSSEKTPQQIPFSEEIHPSSRQSKRSQGLKAKIQEKLQNSNEVLHKKLAFRVIKKSLPNISSYVDYTPSDHKSKTAEKEPQKSTQISETPRKDFYRTVPTQHADEVYRNTTDDNFMNNPNRRTEDNFQSSQPECFVPDWSSISETHWQDLLNSDIFKNYNINPIVLIENNPDYFSHLLG